MCLASLHAESPPLCHPHCSRSHTAGQGGGWPGSLGTKVCHPLGPHHSSPRGHKAHSSSLGVRDLGLPWTQSPQSPPAPSVIKARPPVPSVWLLPDAQVTSQHLSTMTLLVSETWLLKNLSLTTNTQEQPRSSPPRTLPGHCLTTLSRRKARESRNLGCLIPCSDSWAWHTGGSQDLLNEQINE